ncbi:uncharacterized protein RHO25_000725 [Cercospora beticola]|uniref:Uncharacterized protein n=1 Tax=Cercospora beticola TaxID=122368 RepID=A0ABZ0N9E4_CERBT|nr:hypothetical protein RHO25_000725 [Cercospora beticola]CAK1355594.1 unnamed protein product [Cercospora beticola]
MLSIPEAPLASPVADKAARSALEKSLKRDRDDAGLDAPHFEDDGGIRHPTPSFRIASSRVFTMDTPQPMPFPLARMLEHDGLSGDNFNGIFVVERPQSMTVWSVRQLIAVFARSDVLCERADNSLRNQVGPHCAEEDDWVGEVIVFDFGGVNFTSRRHERNDAACLVMAASVGLTLARRGTNNDFAVNLATKAFFDGAYADQAARFVILQYLGGMENVRHQLSSFTGVLLARTLGNTRVKKHCSVYSARELQLVLLLLLQNGIEFA